MEVVKLAIEKKHGAYHEGVICAEHVQIISKTKMKDRLLVAVTAFTSSGRLLLRYGSSKTEWSSWEYRL